MATAWPLQAMTRGRGNVSIRSASLNPSSSMCAAPSPPARRVFRSKPPEKIPSRPVSTATAPAASASSRPAEISDIIATDRAWAWPSSMVMVAIPASTAVVASVPMGEASPNLVPTCQAAVVRCALYRSLGGPEVLEVAEIETPEPGLGEVRVRVLVSAVNPTDWKSRSGRTGGAMQFPFVVPHQDGAGTIDAVGPGVDPG